MAGKKRIIVKTRTKSARVPKKKAPVSQELMKAFDALATVPVPSFVPDPARSDHVDKGSVERVFQRLVKLALIQGATGPLLTTETIYESNLFQIQEYLKHVMEATAKVLGEDAKKELREKFESVDWSF